METKEIITYLEVVRFFRNSLVEGIIKEKEYEEIEIKVAKRCDMSENIAYRILIQQVKQHLKFNQKLVNL